jgi:hypothetical protein
MRRREFIAGLGSAAAWQVAAWAQQGERMRRIGVLMDGTATGEYPSYLAAFIQGLQQLGRLVLLRHKFRRMFRGNLRAQHGQRGSILAIATTIAQWTVAIELGMCRWGRSGGAAGSEAVG